MVFRRISDFTNRALEREKERERERKKNPLIIGHLFEMPPANPQINYIDENCASYRLHFMVRCEHAINFIWMLKAPKIVRVSM